MNDVTPKALKILWVATKSPWPPVDGGRLLVVNTLQGLAALGYRVTLVAPGTDADGEVRERLAAWCDLELVETSPRPRVSSAWVSWWRRSPFSIVRHTLPRVRARVATLLAEERYDLVHVEQLQALAQAEPAFERGLPVVLRAQNVESDLWCASGQGLLGAFARREGRRLARSEGEAVRRVTTTVALSAENAGRLRELAAGEGRVEVVRVPFAGELPSSSSVLEGEPALVLFGSGGWLPNRESTRWFVDAVWPQIRRAAPGARLHVFGESVSGPGTTVHPAPADSRDAFARGSLLVVPLRIASGVRMKILEAWARGVPVVATPASVAGLEATDGVEVLVGSEPDELVRAVVRLQEEAALAGSLIAAGRARLALSHDRERVSRELVAVYAEAVRRNAATAEASESRR